MKKLLLYSLLAGSLFATTGCVDELAYSRGPHRGPSYHDGRHTTTHVQKYRSGYRDRPGYYDDRYSGRRDVRVYDAPRQRRSGVTVVY